MSEFLLLVAPSANRVYADSAPALMAAEASVVLAAFGEVERVDTCEIAGVPYVRAVVADCEPVRAALAHLSAVFAAFAAEGELLRPVPLTAATQFPTDLTTIQKYAGKTNEQWTRLCLNVTASSTRHPVRLLDGSLTVLDPMCGRGTTLNVALSLGLDTSGIDVDKRDFTAYELFIKTWLRTHRLKHSVDMAPIRRNRQVLGQQLQVTVAPTKDAWKMGRKSTVTYLSADAMRAAELLRAGSVDVVVTDTPYGVQHGSHGQRLDRSPLTLLGECLPGWRSVLRTGGAIGLSINRHVAPVDDVRGLLDDNGFEPVDFGESFRHQVDSSIDRDLVVARAV